MGRRGRKRHLAVEDEDWQLILEGVGRADACRQVGITRKTGYLQRPKIPLPRCSRVELCEEVTWAAVRQAFS